MTGWTLFRILNGAMLAPLFLLSVLVQHNDPDPIPWMLIYGAALALCVLTAANHPSPTAAWVVAGIAAAWAATLLPSLVAFLRSDHDAVAFTMKAGDQLEEEARECGGLLIVVAWIVVLGGLGRRQLALAPNPQESPP